MSSEGRREATHTPHGTTHVQTGSTKWTQWVSRRARKTGEQKGLEGIWCELEREHWEGDFIKVPYMHVWNSSRMKMIRNSIKKPLTNSRPFEYFPYDVNL